VTEPTPPLVPADFAVPTGFSTDLFVLEPLGVGHNESDYAAWTSSADHIRATPGFVGDSTWLDLPTPMTLADNARACASHARDFAARAGFAYTVLDPASGEVIGSVYFYPSDRAGCDVDARSWVRADRAALDKPLYDAVRRWLAEAWPFRAPDYAER
jgi:hypothetical protein